MSAPIIFFHQQFDPYILFTLAQARKSNPKAPIVLLGDRTNEVSGMDITHRNFRDYVGRRDEFVGIYQHFSLHELECERLCIERWFYLEAFLEKEGIEECFYLDSDVLLFAELSELLPLWNGCPAAGVPLFFGTCYVRREVMTHFCDYILSLYRSAAQIVEWKSRFEEYLRTKKLGGISPIVHDMELGRLFVANTGLKMLDLRVPRGGWIFDNNIAVTDGFEANGPLKQLYQDDAGGGVECVFEGRRQKLASLHFWGNTKKYESALTGWSDPVARGFLRPNYRRNFKKMIQHLYFGKQFRRGVRPLNHPSGRS